MCDKYAIPLYIDGARCGYGLGATENDVTLADLPGWPTCFTSEAPRWALFGEAVVLCDPALQRDFRYMIKRQGGMLAKGRLLGIQFETCLPTGSMSSWAAMRWSWRHGSVGPLRKRAWRWPIPPTPTSSSPF